MEDESQVASITITRTGDTSGTDTVTFSTSDGTAWAVLHVRLTYD
jgi:hypothetical protein